MYSIFCYIKLDYGNVFSFSISVGSSLASNCSNHHLSVDIFNDNFHNSLELILNYGTIGLRSNLYLARTKAPLIPIASPNLVSLIFGG